MDNMPGKVHISHKDAISTSNYETLASNLRLKGMWYEYSLASY